MSTFKVEVVRVKVLPHPEADRLELLQVKGWQCCAQKGAYQDNDLAIYLPIDSVLPEKLVKDLGIEKMYSKRLRTIKLRNRISQGMCAPLSILGTTVEPPLQEGDDVTLALGVTKYEVPIPIHMSGVRAPDHPNYFKYTDIENIKNYPTALKEDDLVVVSEKIHGTNFRVAKIDGKLFVGSHNMNLVRNVDNLYWRAAILLDAENKLQDGEQVFGEVFGVGVQDLTYDRKKNEIGVRIFDVMEDKVYLDHFDFMNFLIRRGWEETPILFTGKWDPSLLKMAEGKSLLAPSQIREGVVIKPMKERFSEELQGRCIIKAISVDYLLRNDKEATEHH